MKSDNNMPIDGIDPEIAAISVVFGAIRTLDKDAQSRVLSYVIGKLNLANSFHEPQIEFESERIRDRTTPYKDEGSQLTIPTAQDVPIDDADGISPIALKWIKRNGFDIGRLSSLFSVGGDEIDLIATTVPGKSKREKMRSVLFLKAIASYLGTGAARVSHQEVKETCLHYDAFDSPNFAAAIKALNSEVTGSKDTGYALNARGLSAATELVKQMTN